MAEGTGVRVVVGVDGSGDARTAAEWAVREAVAHGGRLVVLHAWSLPVLAGSPDMFVTIKLDDLRAAAEKLLAGEERHIRSLAADLGADLDIETRLEYGSPITALLDAAGEATIVVVGSRGSGRVVGLLLGSVSQSVVTRAACPVLVVPPPNGKQS